MSSQSWLSWVYMYTCTYGMCSWALLYTSFIHLRLYTFVYTHLVCTVKPDISLATCVVGNLFLSSYGVTDNQSIDFVHHNYHKLISVNLIKLAP